jgi:hypothetical protein
VLEEVHEEIERLALDEDARPTVTQLEEGEIDLEVPEGVLHPRR